MPQLPVKVNRGENSTSEKSEIKLGILIIVLTLCINFKGIA